MTWIMFTSRFLSQIRLKAFRRGIWFSSLDNIERGILSLASRVVDRVESEVLGIELVKIISKLKNAMKSGFVRLVEEYGVWKAKELSIVALSWGNLKAKNWSKDSNFYHYLTMTYGNIPIIFKV
jgi:hypothetical protein